MGKNKPSRKNTSDINLILQILAQQDEMKNGSRRYNEGPKHKGKPKSKSKRYQGNAHIPNYDPQFDEPEFISFRSSGSNHGRGRPVFSGKRESARGGGAPRINFIPSSHKNYPVPKSVLPKRGRSNERNSFVRAADAQSKGAGIQYTYASDPEDVDMDLEPGTSQSHANMAAVIDSSEEDSDGLSDKIAREEGSYGGDRTLEDSDEGEESEEIMEDFHIDIVGNPNLVPVPTEIQREDEHEYISFSGTEDVNSIKTQKKHQQDAMQDYIDNISVEDLDMKLNEICLNKDVDESVSSGSLELDSDLGSDPGEDWAEGFREGLDCALHLLPKFARKILTNELKRTVQKTLLPPSIRPKTKTKSKKTPQGLDKKPNEDRRHSVTVKTNCLRAANDAIVDMLNSPFRNQVQFPLITESHRSSVISLGELYKLIVIVPDIKKNPLRLLKTDSGFVFPKAFEIDALIGSKAESPISGRSPQKKAKTGPIVCGSAPPIASSNIGHRLLSQMGWSPGQALGAAGDGILDPIQAEIRKKRQGLGS